MFIFLKSNISYYFQVHLRFNREILPLETDLSVLIYVLLVWMMIGFLNVVAVLQAL